MGSEMCIRDSPLTDCSVFSLYKESAAHVSEDTVVKDQCDCDPGHARQSRSEVVCALRLLTNGKGELSSQLFHFLDSFLHL